MPGPADTAQERLMTTRYSPDDNAIATPEQRADFQNAIAQARNDGSVLADRQKFHNQIDIFERKTITNLNESLEKERDEQDTIPRPISFLKALFSPKKKESRTFVFEDPQTRQVEVVEVSVAFAGDTEGRNRFTVIEDKKNADSGGGINFHEVRELDYTVQREGWWPTSGFATNIKIDFNGDGKVDEGIIHKKYDNRVTENTDFRYMRTTSEDLHYMDTNGNGFIDFEVMEVSTYSTDASFNRNFSDYHVTRFITSAFDKGVGDPLKQEEDVHDNNTASRLYGPPFNERRTK